MGALRQLWGKLGLGPAPRATAPAPRSPGVPASNVSVGHPGHVKPGKPKRQIAGPRRITR